MCIFLVFLMYDLLSCADYFVGKKRIMQNTCVIKFTVHIVY